MHSETLMRRVTLAAAMALLLATMALPSAVMANGVGVTVYLGYLPEVSNWGPFEATGEAYVNAGEGRAHVTVDHLIYDPAIRYEMWLVRADDRNTLFSVGTFEVDETGHADVELHNPDLTPAEFRFVVISAEPASDDDPRPDARRAVAGVFPNTMARPTTGGDASFDGIWAQPPEGGNATVRTTDQGAVASPPPPRLPVTGGEGSPSLDVLLAVAGAASVGLMIAGGARRRASARVHRELSRRETP